ncbi:MAG: hypothetical protein JXB49_15975 [Bacteroidales bacterium]|nr:hypothetical protein [Bacteroidales bacterium]
MSQTPDNRRLPPEECYNEDEINLIDLIYPIYKRRKFLIKFCIVITFFVGIISVFSEKIYEAKAVILPQTSEGGGSGMELQAAFLEQFGVAGLGGSSGAASEIFGAVLKSTELAREVLARMDYAFVMGLDNNQERMKAKSISDMVGVNESKNDPSIGISMQNNDPVMAADIANSYVNALNEYNLTNSFTSARRLREYIEERINAAEMELDHAQKELMEFQEKNRAVSISKQAEATLDVLAELESQKVAIELEKAAKEKFYKGPHMEIEQLEAQMEAIKKNINRLTYSEEQKVPVEDEKGNIEFYIPLTKIPALNYEESKLLLKVKAKTGVITMLSTQIEQAKLDEAKDMPTINTMEWAVPPEFKIKPRVKLNVILGFVVSIFMGIFIIFFREFAQRLDHDPESAPKWKEIKQGFRRLIPFRRGYR